MWRGRSATAIPIVFQVRTGSPISASMLPNMVQSQQIAAFVHSFRSSFHDRAAKSPPVPGHRGGPALLVQNRVDAAYARSDRFQRRRRLMNDWAPSVRSAPPLQRTFADHSRLKHGSSWIIDGRRGPGSYAPFSRWC